MGEVFRYFYHKKKKIVMVKVRISCEQVALSSQTFFAFFESKLSFCRMTYKCLQ